MGQLNIMTPRVTALFVLWPGMPCLQMIGSVVYILLAGLFVDCVLYDFDKETLN